MISHHAGCEIAEKISDVCTCFADDDAAAMKRSGLPVDEPTVPQMARDAPFPPGPYRIGLTNYQQGQAPPWTIKAGNGQCIAGWIDSRHCAVAIVEALKAQYADFVVETARSQPSSARGRGTSKHGRK